MREKIVYNFNQINNTYSISSILTFNKNIVIPSKYNDLMVLNIGDDNRKFYNSILSISDSVESIIVEEGIEKIDDYAFYRCKNLKEVRLPSTIKYIGDYSFENTNVKYIYIPKNVSYIGYNAFPNDCQIVVDDDNQIYKSVDNMLLSKDGETLFKYYGKCETLILSNKIRFIKSDAFSYLNNIKYVYYNGTIEDWCGITFSNETSTPMYFGQRFYIKSINGYVEINDVIIPETVSSLGNFQFYGFVNLDTVILSDNLISIGKAVFEECDLNYNILDNLQYLGSTSNKYFLLIDIDMEKSTYQVHNNTRFIYSGFGSSFNGENIQKIKSLSLKSNIQNFDYNILINNLMVKSVELPDYVNSFISLNNTIKESYSNKFLETLIISEDNENYKTEDGVLFSKDGTILYLYPNNKSDKDYKIPYGVKYLCDYAFYNCKNLKTIYFPDTVESLGEHLFERCSNLKTVELSSSINSISNYMFKNCNYLTHINIPNSVTSIGKQAFDFCKSLKSINFPVNLEVIGEEAFAGCINLEILNLPKSIKYIGDYSFRYCTKIKNLKIPENVNYLGKQYSNINFYIDKENKNFKLTEEGLFSSDMRIMYFQNKNNSKIIIPEGVEQIINLNVNDDLNIQEFKIPNSLITLEPDQIPNNCKIVVDDNNNEFKIENNSLLTKDGIILIKYFGKDEHYEIPNSVIEISKNAFKNNTFLKKITIKNNAMFINSSAFSECINLSEIEFFSNDLIFESNLFDKCDSISTVTILSKFIEYIPKMFEEYRNIKFNLLDIPYLGNSDYKIQIGNDFLDKNVQITYDSSGKQLYKYIKNLFYFEYDNDIKNIEIIYNNNSLFNYFNNILGNKLFNMFMDYFEHDGFVEVMFNDNFLNENENRLLYYSTLKDLFNECDEVETNYQQYKNLWRLNYNALKISDSLDEETIFIFDCGKCSYEFLNALGIIKKGVFYCKDKNVYLIYFTMYY